MNVVVCIFVTSAFVCCSAWHLRFGPRVPQQTHLSYTGSNTTALRVTWSTTVNTSSVVQYGIKSLDQVAIGNSSIFQGSPHLPKKRVQYIHVVSMVRLKPGIVYKYRVGCKEGWSPVRRFRVAPAGSQWGPRLAVYGDMGVTNARSLASLISDTQAGRYDAVFHVGDFAYDMHDDFGRVGDAFLRIIEPIATRVPYMTCPGNHERHGNFSNYKARFYMPHDMAAVASHKKMFYSLDFGPAHIVMISTEFYFYYTLFGSQMLVNQYRWMQEDLRKAANTSARRLRPWIIVMGHRPMYCSEVNGRHCTHDSKRLRDGIKHLGGYGLEALLKQSRVDLAIWGHQHIYERMWPVYNGHVLNGSTAQPYKNAKATIHIVTGSAGCKEGHPMFGRPKPFTAFRSGDYGYTRLHIANRSTIVVEQVSDDKKGAIVDRIVIKK